MKIELNRIQIGKFRVREKLNEEHLQDIMQSLAKDGQWNPIIVRPAKERGYYELIAGEYRMEAAKRLGWKEIEATVKDVNDITAGFLALKTNIFRQSMTPLEEGAAIRKYMVEYDLTQQEIAKELGRSEAWVSERLALALALSPEVREALVHGRITVSQAVIISQISPKGGKLTPYYINRQKTFLGILLEEQNRLKRKLSEDETRRMLRWFLNDTIYTIGYAGREWKEFLKVLKDNGIELIVDVRESGESKYKPEFNEIVLKRVLEEQGIEYERRPDLGVPYEIRQPYIDGFLAWDCFKQWYIWSIRGRKIEGKTRDLLPELVERLKSKRSCLMCEEAYPKPKGSQKHHCHRDILADLILEYKDENKPLLRFEGRVDL
ncbi:MAG: ParB/RepB/Spo0J family partition protein [Candidatus Baldrarchaeia archaeon]